MATHIRDTLAYFIAFNCDTFIKAIERFVNETKKKSKTPNRMHHANRDIPAGKI